MPRRGSKKAGILVLYLLAGTMIGSFLGNILATYLDYDIFTKTVEIGTIGEPTVLDIGILELTFGLTFLINIGTIFGILLGILFYNRW